MSHLCRTWLVCACVLFAGCATTAKQGTLAELRQVAADIEEIHLEDSLELAADSYRRYLAETSESPRTPEAMRRLADLQIEQAYGVLGSGEMVEMAAPQAAQQSSPATVATPSSELYRLAESDQEFEARATAREELLSADTEYDLQAPGATMDATPGGPLEAINTYRQILAQYPNYERNDKVLYQMSRAYDEIGDPDEAMVVMDRLIAEHPYSKHVDEVHFRRGEYYFIRKKYLDAEDSYGAVTGMGPTTPYYELALYKLGWALYKQELYEEALHNYMSMLDYRVSTGFDFDSDYAANDEHRLTDTFRVISLSFSNLGGPEVVDEYFSVQGHREYADKIYGNLGEFYFTKLRYEDAASVYRSFVALNPLHRESPYFSMRVVEIYGEAGFPLLVVEAKKNFATEYALDAEYWNHFDVGASPEVVGFLKTNLTDLAGHYHALYQHEDFADEQLTSFEEAAHWYRQFLQSFPTDADSPQINYRLADLLLENEDFSYAAAEYERTAYEYAEHEQAAAAGYAAVFAHRQDLERATGARRLDVMTATVASSLRFADTFPDHDEAPVVLGAAADDLYAMEDFATAIASAHKLIERYPDSETGLLRSAWAVVANSSIDLAEYQDAENAYMRLVSLTPAEDKSYAAIIDGLAASIYKQGEQANQLEDYRAAAAHFLRIKDVAPTSSIRTAAEYDAAAALIKLEDWLAAADVLEDFRLSHGGHELQADATRQLAFIYRESGDIERSAAEHERIAAESDDPELAREALLTAAELYDEVKVIADAVRVYRQYVEVYPRPLDIAMETRSRLAEIFNETEDSLQYEDMLREMVAADRNAGADRTDRSRYLAAKAALVLAEKQFETFADLKLMQPFEESLAEKQRRMDSTMAALEALVSYEVAEVTAAATYYIAETYMAFSTALMESERPQGLSEAEMVDYELVIEEEAYPFEEQAIDVHQANFELLAGGVYNQWVQSSLDQLAVLMPGRYAKNEISGGFMESIDTYAYRMPIAPPEHIEQNDLAEGPDPAVAEELAEAAARAPDAVAETGN